jgi:hypothetical protein
MDRRQLIVQRARELFAERLDDVLHMVQQDRQELRGWQEPAHVRAVVRRLIQEGGESEVTTTFTMTSTEARQPGSTRDRQAGQTDLEFARLAAEPDRGQQREAIGQLLEAGAAALEKVVRTPVVAATDLSNEEALGLESVLLLYARPAILVSEGRLAGVPPFWNLLEDQREEVEVAQRGVGRIELLNHPEYDWAGTGFLVNETTLLTTRRNLELFADNQTGRWQFRPGITAWMDYRSPYQRVSSAGYRIRTIIGVHDRFDLALLEVEPPQTNGAAPAPLALASAPPPLLAGRPVYLIGYPVRDARRNEPERVSRIFRDVYNVKRVQPGVLRGGARYQEIELLQHDCAPLGQLGGSPILDLETHQVVGMQLSGRYLEPNNALPLFALRDDPLLRRAGVTFAEATIREQEQVGEQIARLARTRYWSELRSLIAGFHQRAFGPDPTRR